MLLPLRYTVLQVLRQLLVGLAGRGGLLDVSFDTSEALLDFILL
jgi:hypothetical protein